VYWSVDLEQAAVVVRQWGFVADAVGVVGALADRLGALGVEGTLVTYRPPAPPAFPGGFLERAEGLLECHVRVHGERRLWKRFAGTRPATEEVGFFPDL
jgi:hypothetical protein